MTIATSTYRHNLFAPTKTTHAHRMHCYIPTTIALIPPTMCAFINYALLSVSHKQCVRTLCRSVAASATAETTTKLTMHPLMISQPRLR